MLKYTKKDFPEKENVRVKCLINTKIIHHENKKYEKKTAIEKYSK